MFFRIKREQLFDLGLFLAAALVLCAFAIFNGYPLVYSDTGTYIHSGWINEVPNDRPIIYGLFIRHISLAESLWFVVAAQALITAYVLRKFVQLFIHSKKQQNIVFVTTCILLAIGTGISQKCSNLLPDFMTANLALLSILFLFHRQMSKADWIFCVVLFLFATTAHTSHLLIAVLSVSFLIIVRLFSKELQQHLPRKRFVGIFVLLFSCWLLSGITNWLYTDEFTASKKTSIFLTGRLADSGLLDEYLLENCPEKQYNLCEWAGQFRTVDFLWDFNNSPLYKTGGWDNADYSNLLSDFYTNPKYLGKYISFACGATLKQICASGLRVESENFQQRENTPPYALVHWRYKHELKQYMAARQQNGTLSYEWVNSIQWFYIITSVVFFTLVVLYRKWRIKLKTFFGPVIFIMVFVLMNATVCASFSIVNTRYGSRTIWLIPLAAILMIAYLLITHKRNTSTASERGNI